MDGKFYLHTKKCWEKGVIVDVVPYNNTFCKINIVINGRITKKGDKLFSQTPYGVNSPLNKKIRELYEKYYNKIIEKENKQKI